MSGILNQYFTGFWALLFPSICKGCGTVLGSSREVLCRSCESKLPKTSFLDDPENPVAQMFWGRVPLENAVSLFYYRKGELLQNLIHQLKYHGGKETGLYLGRLAGKILNETKLIKGTDVLIPVPLHPRKQRIRGYNQSELLAQGISDIIGIKVETKAVIRTIHTESQTLRKRYERWQNVSNIFKIINYKQLIKKHIWILDDIVTTGSTIESLCHTLQEVPEVKMSVLTIGYASG